MKRLLISCILVLIIQPAFAAEIELSMELCSSTGKYSVVGSCVCGTAGTAGANVTSTTSDATVVLTAGGSTDNCSGTVYVCMDASGPVDRDDCINDTNIDSRKTAAISGAESITYTDATTFSGLTQGTTYHTGVFFVPDGTGYDDRITNDDTAIASFPTVASGGAGLETGNVRFIGAGGNDSNDGTSHAQRWLTLGEVANHTLPTGTDVYLLAGFVAEDESITIDWNGSSDDPAILGTYCMDAGTTPIAYDSADSDCSAGKAEINGTFEAADRAAMISDQSTHSPFCGDSSTQTNCVPSNIFLGLITIGVSDTDYVGNSQYITVQDIALADSAGDGVTIQNRAEYITVKNMDISYVGRLLVNGGYGSRYVLIQGNDMNRSGFCNGWGREYGQSQVQATIDSYPINCVGSSHSQGSGGGDYPAGISPGRSDDGNLTQGFWIYHDNDIYWTYGEGIGDFRTNNSIIVGNRVRMTGRNSIYVTAGERKVVENNIVWYSSTASDTDMDFIMGGSHNPVDAASISYFIERNSIAKSRDATEGLFRNNIVAGTDRCFEQASRPDGDPEPRNPIGAIWTHNLCVEPLDWGLRAQDSGWENNTQNNEQLVFTNNIVYAPAAGASNNCKALDQYSEIEFGDNFWDTTPTDTDCQGTGDITGKPNLARDADTWDGANWTESTGPTAADAVLTNAADGDDDGRAMQTSLSAWLDGSEYFSWSDVYSVTEAEWEKEAAYDINDAARSATTPNIGPDETN